MKYKYYFKKPKSEIVKDILKGLLVSGAVYVSANSPYFTLNLIKKFNNKKYNKKKIYDAFYRLRKNNCVKMEKKNHQVYMRLTEKGRKKASWMQVNDLKIKKPKKWDRKWRLVLFDISNLKNLYRNVFRGKLIELGFYQLQKSVWIFPFNCSDEIELLKDFLGMTDKEIRLITADDIGQDSEIRKKFKV